MLQFPRVPCGLGAGPNKTLNVNITLRWTTTEARGIRMGECPEALEPVGAVIQVLSPSTTS